MTARTTSFPTTFAMRAAAWLALAVLSCVFAGPLRAEPVNGDVNVSTKDGYARIVVHLEREVPSTVKVAGGIIIVSFREPISAPVEKIAHAASGYVGAARRDPDGGGFRIALARKVTVNSMAAGERLFIDLLPENWTGVAPGLPQNVIEELASRAREAEKLLRLQRKISLSNQRKTRVRVAVQPTFTRYIFELPDVVPVTTDRGKDSLTVVFSAPLKFDLVDAKVNMPDVVKAIESYEEDKASTIKFVFLDKADIRTFREENNYVVDIGSSEVKESVAAPAADDPSGLRPDPRPGGPLADVEPPQTVPVKPGKPQASASPPIPQRAALKQLVPAATPIKASGSGEPPPVMPAVAAEKAKVPLPPPPAKMVAAPPAEQTPPAAKTKAAVMLAAAGTSEAAAPSPAAPAASQAAATPAAAAAESAPAQQSAKGNAAAAAPDKPDNPNAVTASLTRQGDDLRLGFPFAAPTPAAAFRRADTLWLVFDSQMPIDLSALNNDNSNTIRSVQHLPLPEGQAVRLKLVRPRLTSIAAEGSSWVVTLGDTVASPTRPLGIARNVAGGARATLTIPFDQPQKLFQVADPDIGDTLLVVAALGPSRGFLKAQDFVEFSVLASAQGVVIQPIADDVRTDLSADKIVISRPTGLTLSGSTMVADRHSPAYRPVVFDPQLWGFDRESNFTERQYKLIAAAADATEPKRTGPRLELARFYLSKEMYAEAKGVLDVELAEDRPSSESQAGHVLRAVANILLDRPDEALKELSDPAIGDQFDAPLWRAFAYARQGKWPEARKGFRDVEASIATLPIELQQLALKEAVRAAIEVRDFAGAAKKLHEFETVGMPRHMQPAILVLTGRLAQGLGKNEEALKAFRAASETANRPAAAQAQLREIALRYGLGDFKRTEVIAELETLTALWRGDDTEISALQLLARLYTEEERYRDAFHVMRTALRAHPDSELTRRIQDEAAVTFDSLFLAGKGDAMPAIEALALFYDYRELTPIGRRGDEMIRRLADRLVSVDLLYQASELLQHQIDKRLQGAARSQVATRLAVVYLMDRKPQKALAALKDTRIAELPTTLRQLRLLLEARALSDIGRHELALEVIGNIDRREAIRLRSDILWAAKRYGESAEQIELLYGDRWKQFEPLNEAERADIVRAAIGYALAEDSIGLGRLREKYAPKMQDGPNRRAFEVATAPFGANAAEFRDVAKLAAASDTLSAFLREMRATYPEIGAMSQGPEPAAMKKSAQRSAQADAMPTGSILPTRY